MTNQIEVKIPDIGGATQVDVIEILVKKGDQINVDTPLLTLESDKASMEIPSPIAGVVKEIQVKVGSKVSEGDPILLVSAEKPEMSTSPAPVTEEVKPAAAEEPKVEIKSSTTSATPRLVEVLIPDIGGATDVDVIEIQVKPGMTVSHDQALITLEGDKATMDIPSPYAGVVKEIKIKLGDKVAQGTPVLTMETADAESVMPETLEVTSPSKEEPSPIIPIKTTQRPAAAIKEVEEPATHSGIILSAGPAVRRMARELGVNLALVHGSGRKSRITKEDLQDFVKQKMKEKPSSHYFAMPTAQAIDFSKFGAVESKPLNKIKKLTGLNVHRSWVTIPHVTQFDEADITELENFRKAESESAAQAGYKLTLLAFVCSVVAKALQVYPQFNASLDATGENLIYKKYFNIGIAVDTPNGLVVPVIKDVDKLTVANIAQEMSRLSLKARDKGLTPMDMSGGCFTISSLGGIGGTAFTPIVNSPEVAILGLSRSTIKPVYDGQEFKPRLMLPLSLSYDHRVIDGAEAARFSRFICECLSDIRRVLL